MESSGSCSSPTRAHVEQAQVPNRVRNILNCHICHSPPRSPVATSCGHLCCWPCLHPLLVLPQHPCPLCHASFTVVPIYGADSRGDSDGDGILPRPRPSSSPAPPPALPTAFEIQEAFVIIEMVNERLRNEKAQAFQAQFARFKALFSEFRGYRRRVAGSEKEETCWQSERNVVRDSANAGLQAMQETRDSWREIWAVSHRFEKMLAYVWCLLQVGGFARDASTLRVDRIQ